jgi:hypothetical protein
MEMLLGLALEIQSHHIHGLLTGKRRPGHRCEDAGEIVSRVNIDALGVSRINGEHKGLLELGACRNAAEEQTNRQGKRAEHDPRS